MTGKNINVGQAERWGSLLLGAWAVGRGLKRRSWPGVGLMGLGAMLVKRGVSGHCSLYQAAGFDTAEPSRATPTHTRFSVTVNRPADQVAAAARRWMPEVMGFSPRARLLDFSNEPGFALDDGDRHMTVHVAAADSDERMAIVHLNITGMEPSLGLIEEAVGPLTRPSAHHKLREGLRQFKALVETGEVATIEGQSHGQRSPLSAPLLKAMAAFRAGPTVPTRAQEQKRVSAASQFEPHQTSQNQESVAGGPSASYGP